MLSHSQLCDKGLAETNSRQTLGVTVVECIVCHERIIIAHLNGLSAVEKCEKPCHAEFLLKGSLDHTEEVCDFKDLYLGLSGWCQLLCNTGIFIPDKNMHS